MIIKPEDVILQTYSKIKQSSWVISPDDCVKLHHIPSGITVVSEECGGVFKNKVLALRKLEEELCWIQYEEEV